MKHRLPYLTDAFPGNFSGIGGTIKNRAEDFFVQEIPLCEPDGSGEHVHAEIQKIGITTYGAISRLARAMKVPERAIGYAGLKDARAVTRQVFSIPGVSEHAVMNAFLPDMTVQWASRHRCKLRLGELSGNRFAIKVRDVRPTDVVRLRPVIDQITQRGMPNYFGEQRFGRRDNNDRLGAALVRGDDDALLRELLGSPDAAIDDEEALAARQAFEAGDWPAALRLQSGHDRAERMLLRRLMKTQSPAAAVASIDRRLRRLWVSALQSRIFNQVTAARVQSLDRLLDGDLAFVHATGECIPIASATAEQSRCDRFEISPTGPLVGSRFDLPAGEPRQIELAVMKDFHVEPGQFRGTAHGGRRPMRVRPADVSLEAGVDDHGPFITIAFTLPAGAYATVLLRELMKSDSDADVAAADATAARGDAIAAGGDEGAHAQRDEDGAEHGHDAET